MMLFIIGQSVQLVHDMQNEHLPAIWISWGLLLECPFYLTILMPLAYLLASITTFNLLRDNHELTALKTLGAGKKTTFKTVMMPIIPLFLLSLWITLMLNPTLYQFRTQLLKRLQTTSLTTSIKPAQFITTNKGSWATFAQKKNRYGTLKKVFIAMNNHQSSQGLNLLTAQSLKTIHQHHQVKLVFTQGQRIIKTKNNYSIATFKRYIMQPTSTHHNTPHDDLEDKTTLALMQQSHDPHALATLQWRILLPCSLLIFAYCAWCINQAAPNRRQHNQHYKLLEATLLFCTYLIIMLTAQSWLKTQLSPLWLGIWWPIPLTLAFIIIRYHPNIQRSS
jgi:lipopolysaccharide export system permease protein